MKKSGQVWIETVLYTLIGLTLMGLALGFIMPKINEAKDRAFVEQAINSLSELDEKMNSVIQTGTGNVRQTEFLMKRGEFYVNASSNELGTNELGMILKDITKPYSQPGVEIDLGRIKVRTEEGPKTSTVYLRAVYRVNITYRGSDSYIKLTAASVPYKLSMENKGSPSGQMIWIDIDEISNR